ncbi:MAG: preprotein translocase subunit SecY [Paludibacteraceae bacterium]|nr:preprotein translocase subunit SecY [Paludibacteraceae bacterium]
MKKLIKTIKDICNIPDLRTRILITFLFVLIYRFGSFIVLPGIDPAALTKLSEQTSSGLMALLDMFSGGAFSNASIFALGIMPYISASIVIQLLTIAVPSFQKKQNEGESGRKKIQQYTRYLTVFILLLQGPSYLVNLAMQMKAAGAALPAGMWFRISSTIILCAGSMFVMWLGERITDKGVGNGISFIILVGIIARFPGAVTQEFASCVSNQGGGGLIKFLIEIIALFVVAAAAVLLVQGIRKVPVHYAKRVENGKTSPVGVRNYIPLKVNAAGVMPIIFAQAIMFIPLAVMPWVLTDTNDSNFVINMLRNTNGFWYNLSFAVLIILFTYLYTAITINPTRMAEEMKRNNGFIPNVKPGTPTAEYIDDIMSKITLPGSIFLAIIAILPAIISLFGVSNQFSHFFGGTSLLIIVGVVLDTLQQVESHLLMHHYDGLMESGHIRGRSGMSAY